MKFFAVVAILFVAVSAIPLKPNDMPWRIKQAEINSNKNLDEFVQAWNEKDHVTVLKLTDFIYKIAKSGQAHSVKLNKTFTKVLPWIYKLSQTNHTGLMRVLAWLIDGNRDNKSYYDLETVIQWVQKRQDKGVEDENLNNVLVSAKSSQYHLQTMAWSFVQAIKQLKQDASNMTEVMRDSAMTMREHSEPFITEFNNVMDSFYKFKKSLGN